MADLVAELAAKGRSLPPEERVRLLDLLLESLHDGSGKNTLSRLVERVASGQDAEIVIARHGKPAARPMPEPRRAPCASCSTPMWRCGRWSTTGACRRRRAS
jgi:antitoxin (DNA-binding transcriptional repressor) of toxin-antitoxin stability system